MEARSMLNTAALVDLKAELIRKQELLKKERLQRGTNESSSLKFKNDKLKVSKDPQPKNKKGIESTKNEALRENEELELRRSREILEQKTKLYDKISTGQTRLTEEESELYMVDFQKKSGGVDFKRLQKENDALFQPTTKESEEKDEVINPKANDNWVDFTDLKGYKRTCLKEDLTFYQSLKKTNSSPLLTENLKEEEEKDDPAGPVHYQNIRHKEVRTHGVGYFSFSENEEERKKQMEMLTNMRQQTVRQRDLKEKAKEKRAALLKARLDKVRQRKNIEVKEDEEDLLSNDEASVADIPLPDEMPTIVMAEEVVPPKPFKPRPWDKGKDFYRLPGAEFTPPKVTDSSKNYMEKRRNERSREFAPPDIYSKRSKPRSDYNYPNFQSGGTWQPKTSAETVNDSQHPGEKAPHSDRTDNANVVDVSEMVERQLRELRHNFFKE